MRRQLTYSIRLGRTAENGPFFVTWAGAPGQRGGSAGGALHQKLENRLDQLT